MSTTTIYQENNPFLNSREGDFVPLNNLNYDNDDDDTIGPSLLRNAINDGFETTAFDDDVLGEKALVRLLQNAKT